MGNLRCEDEQDADEANLSSLLLLQQPDSERGDADRKSEVSTGLGAENAGFEPETLGPTAVTERVGWPLDGHVFTEYYSVSQSVTNNGEELCLRSLCI